MIMCEAREKKVYTALLFNAFFVFKQLGMCLFFCIVFHAHNHNAEKIITAHDNKTVICCLHCDHSCEGHDHIDKMSYAVPFPEKEQDNFKFVNSCDVIVLQRCQHFSFNLDAKHFSDNFRHAHHDTQPVKSTVMRC